MLINAYFCIRIVSLNLKPNTKDIFMKRFLLISFLLIWCIIVNVDAKTILKVSDVEVTDDNPTTVVTGSGITGTITYDASNNILVMKNATISTGGYALYCYENVKIFINGTVTLKNTSNSIPCVGMSDKVLLEFYTSSLGSKLNISSQKDAALKIGAYSKCVFTNFDVNCTGVYGVRGDDNAKYGKIYLRSDATLKATGSSGSIINLHTLDADVAGPSGTFFNTAKHGVCTTAGAIVTSEVTLNTPTLYPIYVAGEQVTSANKGDIRSEYINAGKVSYYPSTKVLTVNSVYSNMTDGKCRLLENSYWSVVPFIYVSDEQTIDIYMQGDNKIFMHQDSFGFLYTGSASNITIRGQANGSGGTNASLYVSGCIYINNDNATLNIGKEGFWTPDVQLADCKYGIYTKGTLNFYDAKVSIVSNTGGAIEGTSYVNFDQCGVVYPYDVYYDPNKKASLTYSSSGTTTLSKKIEIEPVQQYGVFVNYSEVHSKNKNNIVVGVKKGSVRYDNANSTLVLNGAEIDGPVVFSPNKSNGMSTLFMKLFGANKITTDYMLGALTTAGNMCIRNGSSSIRSSLTLENTHQDPVPGAAIVVWPNDETGYAKLSIGDVDVTCSYSSAISGTINSDLEIFNTNLTTDEGIDGFKSMMLENSFIDSPVNGYYDETQRALCSENGTPVNWVSIKAGNAYPVAINGVRLTKDNYCDAYALGVDPQEFKYDPETKTLTLHDLHLSSTYGLETFGDVLINCEYDSEIRCNDTGLTVHYGEVLITGEGELSFLSSSSGCFLNKGAWLIIRDANVAFVSDSYGSAIEGDTGKKAQVHIFNSNVILEGSHGYPIVRNLDEFFLGRCEIDNDGKDDSNRVWFDMVSGGLVTAGGTEWAYGRVVIRPTALLGDINGDGEVNTTDVTALYNVIFGTDILTSKSVCDLDNNGEVNTSDVTTLYNIIFGTYSSGK